MKLDYAPRRVLNYMRQGWTLHSDGSIGVGEAWLTSPENDTNKRINPRTFQVLLRERLIMRDTSRSSLDKLWKLA